MRYKDKEFMFWMIFLFDVLMLLLFTWMLVLWIYKFYVETWFYL